MYADFAKAKSEALKEAEETTRIANEKARHKINESWLAFSNYCREERARKGRKGSAMFSRGLYNKTDCKWGIQQIFNLPDRLTVRQARILILAERNRNGGWVRRHYDEDGHCDDIFIVDGLVRMHGPDGDYYVPKD